jgi:hypothetical protein
MKPEHEIIQELRELQSPLAQMYRDMPFCVPENYFNSIADELTIKLKAEGKFTKAHTFIAPHGYFECLPEQLLIKAKAASKPRFALSIPNLSLRQIKFAAAALLLISLSISTLFYLNQRSTNPAVVISKVKGPELIEYAQQNIDDYDIYMHVNHLVSTKLEDVYTQHLSSKDIEQYLNEAYPAQQLLD